MRHIERNRTFGSTDNFPFTDIYIYIYIYIYTYRRYSPRKEAIKFLFMITERESCDYDIVMGKSLSEDEALNTFYFENMERAASKIQTSVCGS